MPLISCLCGFANGIINFIMALAPIVLFVYNRPWHTRQTLESLAKNKLADQSKLFIYSDGPKSSATEGEVNLINEVRRVIRLNKWCKEVIIIESEKNQGLANSIVSGVTDVVNRYEKVIVLEDDIQTSVGFLTYMNDALSFYEKFDNVMHVSGYFHPLKDNYPNTFFYNVNSCWGWGTWKRSWNHFLWDINDLEHRLRTSKHFSLEDFNKGQGTAFSDQLEANKKGTICTWAVRWHASIYIKQGLCLHPGKSLVRNIGFDNSGTHCNTDKRYMGQSLASFIDVDPIPLKESSYVISKIKEFNKQSRVGEVYASLKEVLKRML